MRRSDTRRDRVEQAIDRWIRVHGSALSAELATIAPLSGLSPGNRHAWISKVTKGPRYHRERIAGLGLRITFAEKDGSSEH